MCRLTLFQEGRRMVEVAAGVIVKDSMVLIAQKGAGERLGLKWEFPGGKVEGGETPESCLRRELREEFSIDAAVGDYICTSKYDYGYISVELKAYFVRWPGGEIKLNEHRQIKWVKPSELGQYDFAPADIPIAAEVRKRLELS